MPKWRVYVICHGSMYARYEGYVDVYTDNSEEVESLAIRAAKRRLGKDVAVKVGHYQMTG